MRPVSRRVGRCFKFSCRCCGCCSTLLYLFFFLNFYVVVVFQSSLVFSVFPCDPLLITPSLIRWVNHQSLCLVLQLVQSLSNWLTIAHSWLRAKVHFCCVLVMDKTVQCSFLRQNTITTTTTTTTCSWVSLLCLIMLEPVFAALSFPSAHFAELTIATVESFFFAKANTHKLLDSATIRECHQQQQNRTVFLLQH